MMMLIEVVLVLYFLLFLEGLLLLVTKPSSLASPLQTENSQLPN